MKNTLIAISIAGLLAGCSDEPNDIVKDQCLRVELFQQCMKSLPAGPVATHYNDWSEVVTSCEAAAFYQSMRPRVAVKKECAAR